MNIHINKNGKNLGPYPIEEVNKQIQAGVFDSSDIARQEGVTDWQPLNTIAGIDDPSLLLPPAPPIQPSSGDVTQDPYAPPQSDVTSISLGDFQYIRASLLPQ